MNCSLYSRMPTKSPGERECVKERERERECVCDMTHHRDLETLKEENKIETKSRLIHMWRVTHSYV